MKWVPVELRCMVLASALLGLASTPTLACVPAPLTVAQQAEFEDRLLLQATVFYRGVIENLRTDEYGVTVMDIRWTRTLWDRGAPRRLSIDREYYSQCPEGNLYTVVQNDSRDQRLPILGNGMGVTVIGVLPSDPVGLIILVDGVPDTQRVVRRFQQLRFGW